MIQEFRVGAIIARSFTVMLSNIVPFSIIALIVNAPLIAYGVYYAEIVSTVSPGQAAREERMFERISSLMGFFLGPIETGALTFGVFQQLREERASIGECLRVGFKRLLPVMGVSIVSGLAVAGGIVLLIVPGIIALCMLYVAVPAAIVERIGVRAALMRSRDLTKGHRWNILALVFIFLLSSIPVYLAVASVQDGLDEAHILAFVLVNIAVGMLFSVWQSCSQAISYYHLRSLKESVDVEEIAAVFD